MWSRRAISKYKIHIPELIATLVIIKFSCHEVNLVLYIKFLPFFKCPGCCMRKMQSLQVLCLGFLLQVLLQGRSFLVL